MAYNNNFLFRTSLSDTGTIPAHGSYCSSPDIIVHTETTDPANYFKNNYNSDVTMSANKYALVNFIYVRAKNVSSSANTSGSIRLYRSNSSLFMTPSIWKNNALSTLTQKKYIDINATATNQIVVGDDVFLLNGTESSNFCLVGIVNNKGEETIPSNFNTYNDFVTWVMNTRSVCVRNLNVVNGTVFKCERTDMVQNPETQVRIAAFTLTAKNLPRGTVYGMTCEAANVSKSATSTKAEEILCDAGQLPAGYDGGIKSYATLPAGAAWPDEAALLMDFYIEMSTNENAFQWGMKTETVMARDTVARPNLAMFARAGRLVKIGSCGTLVKPVAKNG